MARSLRAAAVVLSALLVLSFTLFAIDQAGSASRESQNGVAGISASDQAGRYAPSARGRSSVRRDIDAASDAVLSPFASLGVRSSNEWADRGLRTLLGLVVYGLGLAFAARWTAGRAGEPRRRPPRTRPYTA